MALYALLVGINKYKKPNIPELYGPAKDVGRMKAYLESRYQPGELQLSELLETNATKAAVVGAFSTHFEKVTNEDHVLFYFSGHGALEQVHPSLQHLEEDPTIQTLVCYDSFSEPAATGLADKELRYLLKELSLKCSNIVVVMDCCHSGEATRNMEMILKRLSYDVPARNWANFIFSKIITEDTAKAAIDLNELIPQGEHIHLAACEARQSAWEVRRSGIFTSGLLQVLGEMQNNISYLDLYSRVKYLLQKRFDQTPYYYVVAEDKLAQGSRLFLGGTIANQQGVNANIAYNSAEAAWILDKGAMDNVKVTTGYSLPVYKANEGQPVTHARISTVRLHDALLVMEDTNLPAGTYATQLTGLYRAPLHFILEGETAGIEHLERYYTTQPLYSGEGIFMTDQLAAADYVVLAKQEEYLLLKPGEYDKDNQYPPQPLTLQARGYNELAAEQVLNTLLTISRWEFCKKLQNTETNLPAFPISIEIKLNGDNKGSFTDWKENNDTLEATYLVIPNKKDSINATFKLINNSTTPYYCAVLLLGVLYDVDPDMVEGGVVYMPPGKQVWVSGPKGLRFTMEDFTAGYNRKSETYYLQFMASTSQFNVQKLQQGALPPPAPPGGERTIGKEGQEVSRGVEKNDMTYEADWCTRLLTINLLNPNYQKETDPQSITL